MRPTQFEPLFLVFFSPLDLTMTMRKSGQCWVSIFIN